MTELKHCPFCGGRAHLGLHMTDAWATKDGWHDCKCTHYVLCEDCGCRTEYFEETEDAERAWNRRAKITDADKIKDELQNSKKGYAEQSATSTEKTLGKEAQGEAGQR